MPRRKAPRRAPKGHGTVFRLGRRWLARLVRDKQIYEERFDSEEEAREWLARTVELVKQGRYRSRSTVTVGEHMEAWMRDVAAVTVKERSYDTYAGRVRHIRRILGAGKLRDLEQEHVQKFVARLAQEGKAPSTVRGCHVILKAALDYAVQINVIDRNPAAGVRLPEMRQREMRVLTPAQARALLASTEETPFHALWMLMVTMGLRRAEAAGLRWEDIDRNRISLRRAIKRSRGVGLIADDLKTDKSRRTIVVPDEVVEALERRRDQQKFEARREGWRDTGYVFTTRNGTPYDPNWIWRMFQRHLAAADLPPMRVHDLRHTAATWMLHELGLPMRQVQETLGHANIAITLGLYSHLIPGMAEDAARRIGGLLSPVDSKTRAGRHDGQEGT